MFKVLKDAARHISQKLQDTFSASIGLATQYLAKDKPVSDWTLFQKSTYVYDTIRTSYDANKKLSNTAMDKVIHSREDVIQGLQKTPHGTSAQPFNKVEAATMNMWANTARLALATGGGNTQQQNELTSLLEQHNAVLAENRFVELQRNITSSAQLSTIFPSDIYKQLWVASCSLKVETHMSEKDSKHQTAQQDKLCLDVADKGFSPAKNEDMLLFNLHVGEVLYEKVRTNTLSTSTDNDDVQRIIDHTQRTLEALKINKAAQGNLHNMDTSMLNTASLLTRFTQFEGTTAQQETIRQQFEAIEAFSASTPSPTTPHIESYGQSQLSMA